MKLLTNWYSFLALLGVYLWMPNPFLSPKSLVIAELSHKDIQTLAGGMLLKTPAPLDKKEHKKVALGRKLFNETRFSLNATVSCSSCHNPAFDFSDGRPLAVGMGPTTKNSPSIVNSRYNNWFYWDGRADSLALQALGPLESANEHGSNRGRIVYVVQQRYAKEYEAIFGSFPRALKKWWKDTNKIDAYPRHTKQKPPRSLSSFALATIGSHDKQTDVIYEAASKKQKPQDFLAASASKPNRQDEGWIENYESMPQETQRILDEEFFKIGSLLRPTKKEL